MGADCGLDSGFVAFFEERITESVVEYGGFEAPWANTEYMDVYGEVSDFLFAQVENPLRAKALAKYYTIPMVTWGGRRCLLVDGRAT